VSVQGVAAGGVAMTGPDILKSPVRVMSEGPVDSEGT